MQNPHQSIMNAGLFQLITENAPVGIYLTDSQGKCLYVNTRWSEMTGLSLEQASNDGWVNGLHPEDLPLVRDAWQRMVASQGKWGLEYRFQTQGGQIIWVYGYAVALHNDAGERIGFFGMNVDITERKRAEEALRRSQEEWERTFDATSDLVAILDTQHRIVRANRPMANRLGLDNPERLKNTYCYECMHATNAPPDFCPHTRLLADQRPHSAEVYEEQLQGWFNISVNPLFDPGGKLTGSVHIAREITDRVDAVAALQAGEQRFRAMVEASPLGIALVSTEDQRIIQANPRLCQMLGYSMEQLTRLTVMDITHPEDIDHEMGIIARVHSGEIPTYHLEKRYVRKDGSSFWVKINSTTLPDSPSVALGFIENIDEQRQIEHAFQQQQAKYNSIFQAAPVGIGMLINRVFIEINDAMCQMTGYTRQELLGHSARMVYPTQDEYEFVGQEKYRQLAENGIGVVETHWQRKDGAVLDILLSSTALNPQDPQTGIAFTAMDITVLKDNQRMLAESLHEKEALVKEIHHRVKNNLQIVASLLDLQSEAIQDQKVVRALQDSRQRVRAMALIHQQLYQSDTLTQVKANEYFTSLFDNLWSVFANGIGKIELIDNIAEVALDLDTAIALGMIASELVSNSMKHGFPEGASGQIRVNLLIQDNQMILEVADSGVGLTEDYDFRNPSSLGLQLVNLLARQLGGNLQVESSPGTTFRLTCPFNQRIYQKT